jgi:hypothetical protein
MVGSWNNLPDRLNDCNADKFPVLLKAHLWQTVNVSKLAAKLNES